MESMLQIREKLKDGLNLKNIMEIPRIDKIVVNVGFGRVSEDKKAVEYIMESLKKITGQKPAVTKARKAIASFKIRQNQVIGAKVTLRGKKMEGFLKKLITVVFPRVRDFRGVSSKSFDGNGNYTIGFSEITAFPEIEYRKGEKQVGLEITISSTSKEDKATKKLLETLGLPFEKEN